MTRSVSISPQVFPTVSGYTIVEQLYLGSRTAVYRAVHNVQQRPVVIKVLRREYPSFAELVQFRNQYTIAKNLPIAGIVQPLSLEPLGSGYALVMEDFGGMALGKYAQQQSLDLADVLAIALQLADILHALGQHWVVHKDIKPANILIHPESKQVKLIDFSIASLLPKETQEIQSPNVLEGTLAYIAPEQTGRMNRGIDYRADFYSLGVTLYQLLTGILPFASDDPLELMHSHIAKVPAPVHQVKPEIPAMVGAIVAKLMAKNAEDRYQSALGLKHDLEQCLTQWKATGEIRPFDLGQRDLSDRFLIPEKLYGREVEVQTLLNAFDRVANGTSELMLVAGFSGIGKTAVVNEVHKPIVRQRGYFIKGKFDQVNRNIPLSAFVQALRDLMGQVLSESDAQLAQWQAKILAAVGENGQVLIEVIPELEQIIGKQPIAPELSGSAAQNRFNLLFQKFIEVFTTAEHPLVIFLDDLQWADLASLQLLKLLMRDNGYLLVLGAYRDNEVSPVHPFILAVEEIKKTQAIVNTITLAPLAFDDTNHLVADALTCSPELAHPLTELIDRKTKGNPFFTTQFLKALYEEGLICFDCDRRYWECDIAQVNALALTDDVVAFMAQQLQKLPAATQQVLKLAACIGNQFDLATVAIISEQSQTNTATALWNALQEGLILPISQTYKFFQAESVEPSNLEGTVNDQPVNLTYRFLHDRVQQAAYSLIPEAQRQAAHFSIGSLLLRNSSAIEQEERLFEIVSHLNVGHCLIETPQGREELVQLNLRAGQKAKAATAYSAAVNYLTTGITLLPEHAWESHYALTLALHTQVTDVAYLNTDFEQMEQWATLVLQHAQTFLDTIQVQQTQMMAAKAQGRLLDSLQIGLQVLKSLGVEFPDQPTQADIGQAFATTHQLWQGRSPLSLIELPVMTDPYHLAAMNIMSVLVPAAYRALPALMPLLICKQVELSIQVGNCPISAFSYGDYGLMLCGILGDLESGYAFGQLSLAVVDRFQATANKSRVGYIVYYFISHWHEPLHTLLQPLLEAYQSGLESGDLESVAFNAHAYCYYSFCAGKELASLSDEIDAYCQVMRPLKQVTSLSYLEIAQQTVLNLLGDSDAPWQLTGSVYRADEALPLQEAHRDQTGLFYFYFHQTVLFYLFGRYEQAAQQSALVNQYLEGVVAQFPLALYAFYDALIQLAHYEQAPAVQQPQLLARVQQQQEKLQRWATLAPCNHQHRWQLIEAERYRVLGQRADAIEHYDLAIQSAHINGYIQDEALANELAAKFYLGWGKEKIAQDYLTTAYYGYTHWGAKAKVLDLERQYPTLLAPILQQQRLSLSATETVFATSSVTPFQTSSPESSSSSGSTSVSATLDLATVLKASQTLSSEIQLDKLLATLLHTVLENAGADKGALLMPHEHQWFVEAVARLDQPVQVQAIAVFDSLELPHSLINSVKRNLQPVVIVDAISHPTLATDAYIVQHQPQSLLCTPILQQGKLVAILYLENHCTSGAFTRDRVELLNLLCAQAAISLENARLYQEAQNYAQQLEQSQLQIVQSEKMASLGNLVAGVAHEINNPVGFLKGNIQPALDYVQDVFGLIDLYQEKYPTPDPAIQDEIETIDLEFLREDLPKLISSMQEGIDRIRNISTSLRTFSRADSDTPIAFNLHEGIDSTLLILRHRLKANETRPAIEVIKQYGQIPLVECFAGQLNQVFMNILSNAIDALDEACQGLDFETLETNPKRITVMTELINCDLTGQNDRQSVAIRIQDNGVGIPETIRSKIFDHLFTTKGVGKGTGLGLAIARQIIEEKHRGTIAVTSKLGQGTEFVIRLPVKGLG